MTHILSVNRGASSNRNAVLYIDTHLQHQFTSGLFLARTMSTSARLMLLGVACASAGLHVNAGDSSTIGTHPLSQFKAGRFEDAAGAAGPQTPRADGVTLTVSGTRCRVTHSFECSRDCM